MHENINLSRRKFLQNALGTSVALAGLPYLIPNSALAADNCSPNNKINIGMIGLGWMGGQYLLGSFLGLPQAQIVALCDVDQIRLNRAKQTVENQYANQKGLEKYRGCKTYGDFRELLENKDIDAVIIATPEHWHGICAVRAAEAGKDIYCEKPLAYSIEEGKAIVNAVNKYGRIFQTGSQQRSDWRFRTACELVRNGYIGQLKEVKVNVAGMPGDYYPQPEPIPKHLNWDMWLGPAPYRPFNSALFMWDFSPGKNWRMHRDFGGGMMTDWGAHHFDIAQWGMGMDESGPVEVIPPAKGEVWGLKYIYANSIPLISSPESNGILFIGDKGKVEVNRGYLKTWPENLLSIQLKPNDLHLYESNDNEYQFESTNHHANWLECIRTRSKTVAHEQIGFHTLAVCRIGIAAIELNRPLKWDPVNAAFIQDPEANRLLSRPMRSPWHI
jgi:predicted dehydrogenase